MQKTSFSAVLGTFVLCFGFWVLLTWSFELQELAAGAVVSLAVALFASRLFIHEKGLWLFNPAKFFSLVVYCFVFLGELVKANCDVARRCYGGCKDVRPGIVRVPTGLKSLYGEAMLSNSITLTPGTITLDLAEKNGTDDTYLYVHCIDITPFADCSEQERGEKAGELIKGRMEKWIRRIWE